MGGVIGDNGVTLRVTLRLDDKWASHQTKEELIEAIKTRINTSLGFRGYAKKLKIMEKRPKAELKR